ncbi:MAG: hypothetical protein BWY91_01015 [bacterium ADurb.BinA028]|nr:MAG: hypothetical protein BWY91_01015 [bacterium ADurb.BinA028]
MRGTRGEPRTRLGRGHRVAVVQACGERAQRAVDLHPDVVPGPVVASHRRDDEGVVVEREQRGCGVDVSRLGEELLPLVGARGIHLRDLASRDEADDVVVVDRRVAEQPTGRREVAGVRRALVVRRGADRVDEAQLTGGDRGTQAPVCRVEPPLEAHLDRDSGRGLEPRELDGLVETGRDRLLAEGREARPHAGEEDLGMGVGRRGDEQGVEVSPQEGVEVRGDRRTELGRDRGSRRRGRVEQDEVGDGRVGCEGLCVERADPAHANDSDAHGVRAPA